MPRQKYRSMSSPLKPQPEAVADKVLKRVEVSKVSDQRCRCLDPQRRRKRRGEGQREGKPSRKASSHSPVSLLQIARRLQGRLALAHLKTKHGWEDLTLDTVESKYEEVRRNRLPDADVLSDSSSSTGELPYPTATRGLMSSPMKAPLFSDAIGSSGGSTGHRKRTYMASFDMAMSSPTKRYRTSPTAHKSFGGHEYFRSHRQLMQSSPLKARRQHFTTSRGPNVSLFPGTRRPSADLTSPNFAAPPSDDEDDLLPVHSFQVNQSQASPPRTPPQRSRSLHRRNNEAPAPDDSKEEGAAALLYLAASPSPALPSTKTRMEPPSTPPPRKDPALPSSMMTTPGGGASNLLFPATPGQPFDFSDFVNMTPSPAQKPWKTPVALLSSKTPMSVTTRRLTFDEPLHGLS